MDIYEKRRDLFIYWYDDKNIKIEGGGKISIILVDIFNKKNLYMSSSEDITETIYR